MNEKLMKSLTVVAVASAAMWASQAQAVIQYDQNVTNNAIFGSGNINGSYTTDRSNGVELGLRAKVRYPVPANTFLSNGDGTYGDFATGGFFSNGTPGGPRSSWNFEWSINTDFLGASGVKLDDLTYELRLDSNPGFGTTFLTFDPINVALADHSIGDNTTAQGAGVETLVSATYLSLIATQNLAQNSQNVAFFPLGINPNASGIYTFQLAAYSAAGGLLAQSSIDVHVGDFANAPEPVTASLGLMGMAAVAGAAFRRRKA